MASRRPRRLRSCLSGKTRMSRPSNVTRPDAIRPGAGGAPRIDRANVVFPAPLSPTSPRTSPGSTDRLIPRRTVRDFPVAVGKTTRRSSTRKRCTDVDDAARWVGFSAPITVLTRASSMTDPWIDQHVDEIDQDIDDERKDGGEQHEAEYRVDVRIEHALNRVLSGAAPGKDDLDEHGPA